METATNTGGNWVRELVDFLRTQPAVSAVRIDPTAQKVSVATIGNVEIEGLEEKLAECEARLGDPGTYADAGAIADLGRQQMQLRGELEEAEAQLLGLYAA